MALRLKAHTADAAMLFLNVRHRKERDKRGRMGDKQSSVRKKEA